ncbi:MAG: cyclophilin-like fold protein [Anaerolineae bacterium]|nr:cyclophilin-like fold protein [Anaerolineae bacterium]
MRQIHIEVNDIKLLAELNDSPTALMVWKILPINANVNVWGDEIYFSIAVDTSEAPDARADVEVGTLGYWPPGSAFCIFYGPTPVSTDENPRAYSPVNILGKVLGDATVLRGVASGAPIRIDKA